MASLQFNFKPRARRFCARNPALWRSKWSSSRGLKRIAETSITAFCGQHKVEEWMLFDAASIFVKMSASCHILWSGALLVSDSSRPDCVILHRQSSQLNFFLNQLYHWTSKRQPCASSTQSNNTIRYPQIVFRVVKNDELKFGLGTYSRKRLCG